MTIKYCVLHSVFKYYGEYETQFYAHNTIDDALKYASYLLNRGCNRVTIQLVVENANPATETNTGTISQSPGTETEKVVMPSDKKDSTS